MLRCDMAEGGAAIPRRRLATCTAQRELSSLGLRLWPQLGEEKAEALERERELYWGA
jgi:hypothetical protein